MAAERTTPSPRRQSRRASPAASIVATLMQALDTTIANVALPYMQGSVSASQDQIDWVLTSYIVAAAIMTPPTGFLAGRFGLEASFLASPSPASPWRRCCAAWRRALTQIVLFRVLQGAFGAALVPLSQTVLLGTYPRERQGFAMALFGIGVMVGPVLGPVLGGWLTENYSWRWVFYINLPIGIIDLARHHGLPAGVRRANCQAEARLVRLRHAEPRASARCRSCSTAASRIDWFSSGEIMIEAIVAVSALLFVPRPHLHGRQAIRAAGAVSRPQLRRRHVVRRRRRPHLLRVDGAAAALSAELMDYPVVTAGMVMGPRGIGHHGVDADRRPAGRARRHALFCSPSGLRSPPGRSTR